MPALTGHRRVKLLYEEYIQLRPLRQVWAAPVTQKPELEPLFAAALHGVELGFLLLSEFVQDQRRYVFKQPRIEAVAADVRSQLHLLQSIVDGELEEEKEEGGAGSGKHMLSLTQSFPFEFEARPPTTSLPSHSPGLARLISSVHTALPRLTQAERAALTKVSMMLASAFSAVEARWTVGLGIEHQLNQLLSLLCSPANGDNHFDAELVPTRAHNLDYTALVRPEVVSATLTEEEFTNSEDFFFRSVHLGTECWMFVANARLQSAMEHACAGDWHIAAARTMQAARILQYLGDHVLLLTRMNLRDYLELKVQLDGTSGTGSSLVRAARPLVTRLMQPLRQQVVHVAQQLPQLEKSSYSLAGSAGEADEHLEQQQLLMQGLLELYANPDAHAGLYNYCKALEDVESALQGGFYYKHYLLAANVLGSAAKGTMQSSVETLKQTYERQLFPELDRVRSTLGDMFDAKFAHIKGRMMDEIIQKWQASQTDADGACAPGVEHLRLGGSKFTPFASGTQLSTEDQEQVDVHAARQAAVSLENAASLQLQGTGGDGAAEPACAAKPCDASTGSGDGGRSNEAVARGSQSSCPFSGKGFEAGAGREASKAKVGCPFLGS